jgi:hypothetical protein
MSNSYVLITDAFWYFYLLSILILANASNHLPYSMPLCVEIRPPCYYSPCIHSAVQYFAVTFFIILTSCCVTRWLKGYCPEQKFALRSCVVLGCIVTAGIYFCCNVTMLCWFWTRLHHFELLFGSIIYLNNLEWKYVAIREFYDIFEVYKTWLKCSCVGPSFYINCQYTWLSLLLNLWTWGRASRS